MFRNGPHGIRRAGRFVLSVDCNCDLSRIRPDLADAAGGGFRHVDGADIALCEEDLVGQQAAGHIAGVGFQMEFAGIAGGKLYMACAPFNRNLVCGGHVIQGDAADASG